MTDHVDISIVSGTVNRLGYLQHMVGSVRAQVRAAGLAYEIILVDGGSTDGTQDWIGEQPDVIAILQGEKLGADRAFCAGFRAAQGDYVVNLNDDATLRGDVIDAAKKMLAENPKYGQIALPYTTPTRPRPVETVRAGHSGLVVYANFGMTRKWLGDQLDWWRDDLYRDDAGDTHLSVAIWDAGYRVQPLVGDGYIEHLEIWDDTRRKRSDAPTFFSYWEDWEGPNSHMLDRLEQARRVATTIPSVESGAV